jgi:Na+/proline symporter
LQAEYLQFMIMIMVVVVVINCVWSIGGMVLTGKRMDSEKNLFVHHRLHMVFLGLKLASM